MIILRGITIAAILRAVEDVTLKGFERFPTDEDKAGGFLIPSAAFAPLVLHVNGGTTTGLDARVKHAIRCYRRTLVAEPGKRARRRRVR